MTFGVWVPMLVRRVVKGEPYTLRGVIVLFEEVYVWAVCKICTICVFHIQVFHLPGRNEIRLLSSYLQTEVDLALSSGA